MPIEKNSMLFGSRADESTSTAECCLLVDLLETRDREGVGGQGLYADSQS